MPEMLLNMLPRMGQPAADKEWPGLSGNSAEMEAPWSMGTQTLGEWLQ